MWHSNPSAQQISGGTLGNEVITSTTLAFSGAELSISQSYTYASTSNHWNMPWLPWGFTEGTWGQMYFFPLSPTIPAIPADNPQHNLHTHNKHLLPRASKRRNLDRTSPAQQYTSTMTDSILIFEPDNAYSWLAFKSYTDEPLIGTYTITYNSCEPMLSVPTQLYSLQPLWTGCVAGRSAFFDPPSILSTASGFAVPTTVPTAVPEAINSKEKTKSLAQGGTPVPATPMVTPALTSKPGTRQPGSGNLGPGDPRQAPGN